MIAVGQENAFPWVERDIGTCSTSTECRWTKDDDVDAAGRILRGDAAFGPKNIMGGRAWP